MGKNVAVLMAKKLTPAQIRLLSHLSPNLSRNIDTLGKGFTFATAVCLERKGYVTICNFIDAFGEPYWGVKRVA